MSTRGGDFEISLAEHVSVGYLSHTDTMVRPYLEEAFTFRILSEASVALMPSSAASAVRDS